MIKFRIQIFLIFLLLAQTSVFAQNQNLSNGFVFDGEPYLAVNPSDPHHLVVAWMGFRPQNELVIKTRTSFDGGQSWSATLLTDHVQPIFSSADPGLAFDGQGNLFLSFIDFNTNQDSGSIFVRKSTDGGLSWGNAIPAISMHSDSGKRAIDRPWMVVDRSGGPRDGEIYLTSMNLGIGLPVSPPYHPYLVRSDDQGASFGPWRHVDTLGWEVGNLLAIPVPSPTMSSGGVLHVAYPSWVIAHSPYPRYILASSTDGGASFSYQNIFYVQNAADETDAKKGYLLKANPADPNHLVFLYLGKEFGDTDVLMRETRDGGANWSAAIRVNDDPIGNNRLQDLVWADFDTDGDLAVCWRDRRNGTDSTFYTSSEIYGAFRPADSASFLPNFPISDSLYAYDSLLTLSGNDFMCITLREDTLSAVWGDVRNGTLSIWYNRMGVDGQIISSVKLAEEAPPGRVFPNPATGKFWVEGKAIEKVRVRDLNGSLLREWDDWVPAKKVAISPEKLPAGQYMIEVFEKEQSVPQTHRLLFIPQ